MRKGEEAALGDTLNSRLDSDRGWSILVSGIGSGIPLAERAGG